MKKTFALTSLLCSIVLSAVIGQPHTGTTPRWCTDGKRIIYVAKWPPADAGEKWPESREIWIMKADGSERKKITTNRYANEYPTLSPNGKTILFSSNRTGTWKLYTINIDGSNEKDLGLESTSSDENDPCYADWSPDGKYFCFPWTKNGQRLLHIANSDGTGVKGISTITGLYPHWSSDGKSITYYSKGNIHTINVDGTNHRQITDNTDPTSDKLRPIYAQWSADGNSIYFIRGDDIVNVSTDGSNEKLIASIPGQKWYLTISKKGKLAYNFLEHKPDVVLDQISTLNSDGSGLTLITK